MKCLVSDEVKPPIIRKSKRKIAFKRQPDGSIVGSKWPKPRGNRGTPNQASWVQDFVQAAKDIKYVDPCTFQQATDYAEAPCSGYTFYRDYLMTARAGKLIYDTGLDGVVTQKPRLFRNPETGIPRVTTPTAKVSRTTPQNLTNSVTLELTPNNVLWDNNAFFVPSESGSRFIIRASGVYMIVVEQWFNNINGGNRQTSIWSQEQSRIGMQITIGSSAVATRQQAFAMQYLNAGDQIYTTAYANANGVTVQLAQFLIMAITPETII